MDNNKYVEYILKQLNITEPIIAMYPYGSRVYNCHTPESDEDFVIVTAGAFTSNGSFKNNAISSADCKIQGVVYSRSGFIDAINNYALPALECLSLPQESVLLSKWPFKISKWDEISLIKRVVTQSSNSWHIASLQSKSDDKELAKRGIFHALRILYFGIQLRKFRKITDFTECNELKYRIQNDTKFDDRNYLNLRNELMITLKTIS